MSCKKSILFVFALFLAGSAKTQGFLTDTFIVEGTLLDKNDSVPIPFAHAYTMDHAKFQVSDEKGKFSIQLQRGDTLVISSIGYATRFFMFTDIPPNRKIEHLIYMSQDPVELQGITVYGKAPMDGFYDHGRVPYDKFEEKTLDENYFKPSLYSGSSGAGMSVGVSGVITLLAAQFNSQYKQLKKLEEIRQKEFEEARYQYFLQKRLNNAFIVQNTALLKSEVEDFVKFWSPDTAFIELATEYELVTTLKMKERQYIEQIKRTQGSATKEEVVSTIELRKLLEDKGNK